MYVYLVLAALPHPLAAGLPAASRLGDVGEPGERGALKIPAVKAASNVLVDVGVSLDRSLKEVYLLERVLGLVSGRARLEAEGRLAPSSTQQTRSLSWRGQTI